MKTEVTNVATYREKDIVQWGIDRNLIGPTGEATPQGQHRKTLEEFGELKDALAANDEPGIIDGIGDTYVTLVMQAHMHGATMTGCSNLATVNTSIALTYREHCRRISMLIGRIGDGIEKGYSGQVMRGIGDTLMALIALSEHLGIRMDTCIDAAWN